MNASPMILQRLRLGGAEFHFDPPRGKFDPALWERRARRTYWKTTGDVQWGAVLDMPTGGTISGDTFFNAFYIAHWRKLTGLRSLSLQIQYEGEIRLAIFCHTERGESELILESDLEATKKAEYLFVFPAEKIASGLRFSFRLTALRAGGRLLGGAWLTTDSQAHPVRLTVGIIVHNREDFAARIARQILNDPLLRAEGIHVLLIDQTDDAKFDDLAGDHCRVIRQPNLGSSGGVSRAMAECLQAEEGEKPTHLLVLEDDMELETDSILRAHRLAQRARHPFLLGGVRLDAYFPTGAHALGASLRPDASGNYENWQSGHNNLGAIDVSLPSYADSISIPYASDFSGWWYWMVPLEAVLKVGMPMALFQKGADVDYGLRAHAQGYASHTLPGLGGWQVPAYAKSGALSLYLEGYFKYLLNAASRDAEVAALFRMESVWALQQIRNHRYQKALARIRAMEDFLGGWEFYKTRIFPDAIMDVESELATYEPNELSLPRIRENQAAALQERLKAIVARFPREAKAARESLRSIRSKTGGWQLWEKYLAQRSYSFLPG